MIAHLRQSRYRGVAIARTLRSRDEWRRSLANCARKIAGLSTVAAIFASSPLLGMSTIEFAGLSKTYRVVLRHYRRFTDRAIKKRSNV